MIQFNKASDIYILINSFTLDLFSNPLIGTIHIDN